MNLPKLQSITKKLCVALLGGFLLIFLLFHACANLCILRHDDGAWYSAFCHFMGTNWIVKVFEVVLIASLVLHIIMTLWLWFTNRKARGTERYHQPSKTKTHTGSKLMIWTGTLMLVLIIVHFCDFYFVKIGFVEGQYMAKSEDLVENLQKNPELQQDPEIGAALSLAQYAAQSGMSAEEVIAESIQQVESQLALAGTDSAAMQNAAMMQQQLDQMKEMQQHAGLANAFSAIMKGDKWARHINKEQKTILEEAMPELEVEPDFYFMAREKFHNPLMAILYLIFFAVVWFHMRHAFASAFQTLGLNNYKYNKAIECVAQVYAWLVCLMFAAVVILVFLGF